MRPLSGEMLYMRPESALKTLRASSRLLVKISFRWFLVLMVLMTITRAFTLVSHLRESERASSRCLASLRMSR
jgi:hypothetical protein